MSKLTELLSEDKKQKIYAILTILLSAALVGGIFFADHKSNQKEDACAAECGEFRSKVIEGVCTCATPTGWVKSSVREQ